MKERELVLLFHAPFTELCHITSFKEYEVEDLKNKFELTFIEQLHAEKDNTKVWINALNNNETQIRNSIKNIEFNIFLIDKLNEQSKEQFVKTSSIIFGLVAKILLMNTYIARKERQFSIAPQEKDFLVDDYSIRLKQLPGHSNFEKVIIESAAI